MTAAACSGAVPVGAAERPRRYRRRAMPYAAEYREARAALPAARRRTCAGRRPCSRGGRSTSQLGSGPGAGRRRRAAGVGRPVDLSAAAARWHGWPRECRWRADVCERIARRCAPGGRARRSSRGRYSRQPYPWVPRCERGDRAADRHRRRRRRRRAGGPNGPIRSTPRGCGSVTTPSGCGWARYGVGRVAAGVGRHRTVDGERLPAPVGRAGRGARRGRRCCSRPHAIDRADVARRRPDRVARRPARPDAYSGVVGERGDTFEASSRSPYDIDGGRAVRARAPAGDAGPAGHGDARSDPQGRVRARAAERRPLPRRAAGRDRPHSLRFVSRCARTAACATSTSRPLRSSSSTVRRRQRLRPDGVGGARRAGRSDRQPARDRRAQLRRRHRARSRRRPRTSTAPWRLRRHPRRRRRLRLRPAARTTSRAAPRCWCCRTGRTCRCWSESGRARPRHQPLERRASEIVDEALLDFDVPAACSAARSARLARDSAPRWRRTSTSSRAPTTSPASCGTATRSTLVEDAVLPIPAPTRRRRSQVDVVFDGGSGATSATTRTTTSTSSATTSDPLVLGVPRVAGAGVAVAGTAVAVDVSVPEAGRRRATQKT